MPTNEQRALTAAAALQRRYEPDRGVWADCWWQSANALEALVDCSRLSGTNAFAAVPATTYAKAQSQAVDFLNKYVDDQGWWALAWLKAFDLTGEEAYLAVAQRIFRDMACWWDGTFAGGLWWTKERTYKNAITNELFLVLAARLQQRVASAGARQLYLDWAEREWRWFAASGMIGDEGLVNDGLDKSGRNNNGVTWTYNQGVILGGLAELYKITGEQALLGQAERIADAAVRNLVHTSGILREPCESKGTCDGDQEIFKGIFVRYLALLGEVLPRDEHAAFIQRSADSVWSRARSATDEFDLSWVGPYQSGSVQRQVAALDLFNAAMGCARQFPLLI
jgi:predicted alpha-1,6-mannanase (GH76 family)